MMKYVSNIDHYIGSHCSSTLMSDVLRKYNINLSEEMCFGIGSGLGFLYRKCWSPSYYMILGRGHDIEEKIGQHLGFFTDINISYDNDVAWNEVKKLIDSDRPVILDVDAALLPYMKSRFSLFDYVRYGGHKACLVGYDDDAHKVALVDYAWQNIQIVSYEELAKARNSDIGEFPSANMWISFYFPQKKLEVEDAIFRGIGYNIHTMKHPVTTQTGLSGMEKFLRQVTYWPIEKNEEQVRKNAYIAYMMLETVGTGGGNFRKIYARFLKEAGNLLGINDLTHMSDIYFNLASNWSEIAKLLKKSSDDIKTGIFKEDNYGQRLLEETSITEKLAIDELERIVIKNFASGYLFIS
ncbi:hypothetical protein CSC2_13880 [Clostridium zeae]|uniref:DUF4872 domain-containing protein n=1 Tax=Clostridium zeae TaxID=2759022 RepID=A0ABQ1E7V5_9CLOT|nr:BtrH N-terminal domain-containing protein [Clostridium zeae]GFZ30862.1 hypothetical protein CSC2_13880 [Clostridium zeae]